MLFFDSRLARQGQALAGLGPATGGAESIKGPAAAMAFMCLAHDGSPVVEFGE